MRVSLNPNATTELLHGCNGTVDANASATADPYGMTNKKAKATASTTANLLGG